MTKDIEFHMFGRTTLCINVPNDVKYQVPTEKSLDEQKLKTDLVGAAGTGAGAGAGAGRVSTASLPFSDWGFSSVTDSPTRLLLFFQADVLP